MRLGGRFGLPLLPQTSAGCSLAFEIFDRVFQRHAVMLEESVESVPRRNVQELAELVPADSVHPVGIDGEGLQRGARQILSVLGQLSDGRVWEVQPDLHDFSIELSEKRAQTTSVTAPW